MTPPVGNLPKQIILLGWVSFFADVSSEMIYPLMPLFLVGVLGSPLLALGVIEGVAQIIVSVMFAFGGAITDKTGRRIDLIRWGYGLPILGKALLSVAGSWHIVLVGRSIDRFGKGFRGSPRDALIADAISAERRGEAFGFHRMMDTSGAFIGVLLAGGALWLLQGNDELISYRLVFGFAALLALCSFIISFFVDEDTKGASHNANEKRTPSVKGSGLSLFRGLGRDYWITLAILGVFAFANSSDAFLLLRASHVGLSPLQVVMVYALYNLSYALFSYRAGTLSDRYGRWQIIAIGWTLYATVYGGIALTNSHYIWGLFLIYGLYMALTEGVSKALIVDSVPADKRGSALGLLYLVLGCSALTSNILAGYLWENFGMSAPFWVGSVTAFGGVIVIFLSGSLRASSTMASS